MDRGWHQQIHFSEDDRMLKDFNKNSVLKVTGWTIRTVPYKTVE